MKKLLFLLSAVLIFATCEGPPGRDGLDGYDGEGMNWKVINYTVYENDWVLVGRPNDLESYYKYTFSESLLTRFIFENGNVFGYRWIDANTQTPLAQTVFMGENGPGGSIYFSDTYSFSFSPGSITFYVDYSDFATQTLPPTCDFRIVLNW